MTSATLLPSSSGDSLRTVARNADLAMLLVALASAIGAVVIGNSFGSLPLAFGVSGPLLLVAAAAFRAARGSFVSMTVLTACNVALIALHIQLGRGTLEFHFGVFVLLGTLLVYRDWRPILLAAGLVAVHHLVFDRLQALNLGVYCTPEANFSKTLFHAVCVIVQTGVELSLAVILRKSAVEAGELAAIAHAVDADGAICLDVSAIRTSTRTAFVMKAMLLKISESMREVKDSASSVEMAASEIARGNLDLSQRTEEQAKSLQQTAASMEQLTGNVRSTGETAASANQLAGSTSAAAASGGAAMSKVVATMEQIGDAVNQLDAVTQQNAALVEEGAAAAESLRQQSVALIAVITRFTLAPRAEAAELLVA